MDGGNLVEHRLRSLAEAVVATATAPAPVGVAALEELDEAAAALIGCGLIAPEIADGVVSETADALVVRGVEWLAPALPDLDVHSLVASATAGPPPELRRVAVSSQVHPGGVASVETVSGPEWWEGMAPLEVPAPERAGGHRLLWRDARLELADHPDPEAERAVVALGGERCPCLDVLEAWDACHRSGAMLIAGGRHAAESLVPPLEATRRLTDDLRHWRRSVALILADARAAGDTAILNRMSVLVDPVERAAARRLGFLLLLGLDQRLCDRLQASVAATLARSGRSGALAAATAARALPALRAMGWAGAADDICLGAGPAVDADRVVLPPGWLAAVWGRGVAGAVPGHLVVDVVTVKADRSLDVVAAAIGKGSFARSVDQWENAVPHTSPGAT